jgi:hypothetical protein
MFGFGVGISRAGTLTVLIFQSQLQHMKDMKIQKKKKKTCNTGIYEQVIQNTVKAGKSQIVKIFQSYFLQNF